MPRTSKVIVLVAFGSRLPLIAVIVLRLIDLASIRASTDYTWDLTKAEILSQLELHYGLFAMTLPTLRPLLRALDTGMLAARVGTRVGSQSASPSTASTACEAQQPQPAKMRCSSDSVLTDGKSCWQQSCKNSELSQDDCVIERTTLALPSVCQVAYGDRVHEIQSRRYSVSDE